MRRAWFLILAALAIALPVRAGNVFVTGHDPDFHGLDGEHAAHLLETALEYVTCGTTYSTDEKFLVISARPADLGGVPAGHRDPVAAGFASLGLVEGVHFDVANAAAIPGADFSQYTALAVVSSFGGLLSRRELDALVARRLDIVDFLEAGGGVFASAECDSASGRPCGAALLDPAPAPMYGFLPFPLQSVGATPPYTLTPFGESLGLAFDDVNDPTHNSFLDDAGLMVVDYDATGLPTTLAGNWLADPPFPYFDEAWVEDPSDCGAGLLVSWEEAVWEDPILGGIYNLYRSEGPIASCDDALSRAPVATGLDQLSWFDRSTEPGVEYLYVVEAEDAQPPHGCDPPGPRGGALAWACTEPALIDAQAEERPEGVFATLFLSHDADAVTLEWPSARALLPGERFRLFKDPEPQFGPFELLNDWDSVDRRHVDLDTRSPLQFFELRVADSCDQLSADEYPAGP